MMRFYWVLVGFLLIAGCREGGNSVVEEVAEVGDSAEITHTPQPSKTSSPIPTLTQTLSPTPEPTSTSPSISPTPKFTKSHTQTPLPQRTPTPTPQLSNFSIYSIPSVQTQLIENKKEDTYREIPIDNSVDLTIILNGQSLTIIRAGIQHEIMEKPLFEKFGHTSRCHDCWLYRYLEVIDLNNDNELEFILSWPQGGYSTETILFFNPDTQSYTNTEFIYSHTSLIDINSDGLIEIKYQDELYSMVGLKGSGASRAISPMRFVNFQDGKIFDVSSTFPEIMEANALHWIDGTFSEQGLFDCEHFLWGVHIAEMHLINRGDEAWDIYEQTCWFYDYFPTSKELISQALIDYGYTHNP